MFHIIVRTKYQDIINDFLGSFTSNTNMDKVELYVIYRPEDRISVKEDYHIHPIPSTSLGNSAHIPLLLKIFDEVKMSTNIKKVKGYLGIYNDDLFFHKCWLEEIERALQFYDAVSPGYINTLSSTKLEEAYENTKNETDVIKFSIGSCMTMRLGIFPQIGMLDPQFDWACDDLDLIWRMELNGLTSVTLKKILIAHAHGRTRVQEMKRWNMEHLEGIRKFKEKHGILSYIKLKNEYKVHDYFMNYGK